MFTLKDKLDEKSMENVFEQYKKSNKYEKHGISLTLIEEANANCRFIRTLLEAGDYKLEKHSKMDPGELEQACLS